MTPIIEKQLLLLKERQPNLATQALGSGALMVTVPSVNLPPGWSKPTTSVTFLVPVGFPFAAPDCFWADADLTLLGSIPPQASLVQPIPEAGRTARWFSWHVNGWDPNRDSILTYFAVIQNRFRTVV